MAVLKNNINVMYYPAYLKRIFIYLLTALALVAASAPGLPARGQPPAISRDSARIRVRSLPPGALQKYRKDEAFDYQQHYEEGLSLWDRFWMWVFSLFSGRGGSTISRIWNLLFWGLCIFFLIFGIVKATGMSLTGLFTGSKKSEELAYAVSEDDIYGIHFSKAIAEAIAGKNFRLAVRLLYLQTLRRLADGDLIRWKLNKTNDVYAQELTGSPYHDGFAYLTRAYDYAWYGDFPLQEHQFTEVQQYFTSFQQQLP